MALYRKKPVVIEAVQLDDDNATAVAEWCGGQVSPAGITFGTCVFIDTLEGVMRADEGDYIIRGVQGECYPCKPDIFAATYELAE